MKQINSLLRGLTYLLCCLSISTFAQTFSSSPSTGLTDNNCPAYQEFPIAVSSVSSDNVLKEVLVNINHTWSGDLEISLVAPDGTLVNLVTSNINNSSDDYIDTRFRDDASLSVTEGTNPFTGEYRPLEPLSSLGNQTNGDWNLRICDQFGGDTGTLNSWSLTFEPQVQASIDPGCVTYYPGYFCPEISVEAFSGTAPYTYLWSDGSETATTTVCPTETSVYSVTVTDASGETATAEVTVVVTESVACQNGKVMVCHTKGNGTTSTLCISQDSVQDHLDHGDTIGSCDVDYYTCDSLPSCPTITAPSNNASNVPIPVTIEWTAASGLVDGYHVSVSTQQIGGTDFDYVDVGLDLEYTLDNLDYLTSYYVAVTAYNDNGDSENCNGITFKTQKSPCDLATTVFCNGVPYTGTTVGGTLESGLGTCGTSLDTSPGVWYKYTGTGDLVTVDTQGSVLDTKLGVFTGNCGNLTCLDGNDDGFGFFGPSKVSFSSISGTTYYIFVTGYSTNEGDYTLNVSCATPIVNDDCSGALSVRVNDYGDECAITFPADHTNASDSGTAFNCDDTDNIDSWYTFIGPGSGIIELSTDNGTQTGSPGWAIYDECSGNIVFCANNTSTTQSVLVTPGTSYVLAVWYDTGFTQGTFDICLNEGPPPAENDECSGAINVPVSADLTCPNPVVGSTDNSSQSLPGCTGTADDDVWYSFVATGSSHTIIINNTGGSTDIVTQVFDACSGNSILCQDSPNSPVELTGLTASQTYYFRIYTWFSGSTSEFEVCVGTPPPPPANDECSGAIALTVNASGSECEVVYNADHSGATDSFAGIGCDGDDDIDTWYTFVAPQSGIIDMSATEGSQTESPGWAIYDGCDGSEVFCVNNTSAEQRVEGLTPDATYTLVVWYDGFATKGTFDICLNEFVPAGPTMVTCGSPVNTTYCYTDFDNTTFAFQSADGSALEIVFNSGTIESCCDDIIIYDGLTTSDPILYYNNNGGDLSGLVIQGTGDALLVAIDSDSSVSCSSTSTEWNFDVDCYTPSGPTEIICGTPYNETYCYVAFDNTSFSYTNNGNGPLTIEFNAGYIESSTFDHLRIYDGVDSTGSLLWENGSSTISNLDGTYATSATGNLFMVVTSDDSVQCDGFSSSRTWDFDVYCGEYVPAGPTLVDCGSPVNTTYCYTNFDSTTFAFQSQDGTSLLEVVFNAGYIESCCDRIRIYDGLTNSAPELYFGNNGGNLSGLAVQGTGNALLITIESDSSVSCSTTSTEWNFDVDCYTPSGPTEIICGTPYNEVYCYNSFDTSTFSYSSSNGSGLTLDWNSGSIESSQYDHIYIYDGTDSSGVLLYTNGSGTTNLAGLSLFAASGNIFIEVDSDSSFDCDDDLIAGPWDFDVSCNPLRLNSMDNDWSMAPNPTKGNVTLDLINYLSYTVTIEVVDFTGKVISTANVKEVQSARYTLELRNSLPAGMYFVRVAANGQVSTKKLMIMR